MRAAHIAIIGSGPSGFYAAEALMRSGRECRVDLFERLPAPHGLVRYGVAPDHQKLKSVAAVFDRIATHPGVGWFGGIEIGRDLPLETLRSHYHAVVLACGAPVGRRLGVPGEDLAGVVTSDRFVGWYNGHPDHHAFDVAGLDVNAALVVGHGNVAIDVCRLLIKDAAALLPTDLTPVARAALGQCPVHTIHLVGRGGPDRAKFTVKELRELSELPGLSIVFPQGADRLLAALDASPGDAALLPIWRAMAMRPPVDDAHTTLAIWFGAAPARFIGDRRLEQVELQQTAPYAAGTLPSAPLPCGLVVSCIGYRGVPPAGVPSDERAGIVPNRQGRVITDDGNPVAGLYVTGWLKRGPTGVVGTNRADSVETVERMLEDWSALLAAEPSRPGAEAVHAYLAERALRHFTYADWQLVDAEERRRGTVTGTIREKAIGIEETLRWLQALRAQAQPAGQ